MYPAILRELNELANYRLPEEASAASSVATRLGVFAARELDDASGEAAELAKVLHGLSWELRQMAGGEP